MAASVTVAAAAAAAMAEAIINLVLVVLCIVHSRSRPEQLLTGRLTTVAVPDFTHLCIGIG